MAQPAAKKAAAPTRPALILVLGDSLSAEYGLARGTGWVALLEKQLAQEKLSATIVNASVSGETTAGGRARLAILLAQHKPTHVVIELGGNDALRGLPLKNTEENLSAMTQAAQKAGAKVLLVGMRMPPNLGQAYTEGFEANYREIATAEDVALLPFLLEPVAGDRDAFQDDNLHPTAEVQPLLRDHMWEALEPLLE